MLPHSRLASATDEVRVVGRTMCAVFGAIFAEPGGRAFTVLSPREKAFDESQDVRFVCDPLCRRSFRDSPQFSGSCGFKCCHTGFLFTCGHLHRYTDGDHQRFNLRGYDLLHDRRLDANDHIVSIYGRDHNKRERDDRSDGDGVRLFAIGSGGGYLHDCAGRHNRNAERVHFPTRRTVDNGFGHGDGNV